MIIILDVNLNKLGTIKNYITANRREELNGENTLDFEAILDTKLSELLNENSILELDGDYFDTAVFKKMANDDGTYTVEVESEHVSYRLNKPEYDKEYFTEDGTPEYILGKILEGTGFTIGAIDFTTIETYSAQESKSRRQLLMEYVAYLKGEVKFHKFEVSILQHRGRADVHPLIKDKDVRVLSKTVNKREKDENGNPLASYSISPMNLDDTPYELGDNVRLIQKKIGINEDLRVVNINYDPYDRRDINYTFSNYENGLESAIFRINRDSLIKDKVYNGIRISPEIGFEAISSDNLARAHFGADQMAFQTGDGTGENWYNKLYYMLDTITGNAEMYFGGKLTVDALEAIKAEIDFVISNTIITQTLAAETGTIAQLTVDQVETSTKVQNYLVRNTADVNYQKIYKQHHLYITASTDGSQTEQATDRNGNLLYWVNDMHTGTTLEETNYPIIIYVYTEYIKMDIGFYMDNETGNNVPCITMGIGTGTTSDSGKGKIRKATDGLEMTYSASDGEDIAGVYFRDDGFVDVTSRRSNISINTTSKSITITPEGDGQSDIIIDYIEVNNALTLIWPDGKSFVVEVTS